MKVVLIVALSGFFIIFDQDIDCLFGIFFNFGVIFEFLKFSKMFLECEWVTLGGLFSNFYSDFACFCLFLGTEQKAVVWMDDGCWIYI